MCIPVFYMGQLHSTILYLVTVESCVVSLYKEVHAIGQQMSSLTHFHRSLAKLKNIQYVIQAQY